MYECERGIAMDDIVQYAIIANGRRGHLFSRRVELLTRWAYHSVVRNTVMQHCFFVEFRDFFGQISNALRLRFA